MDIKPVRLQRKRVKGFKVISPNGLENVFVSRSFEFCNPYKIGSIFINENGEFQEASRKDVLKLFEKRECSRPQYINKIKEKLKGKNLVCWCSLNEECHADLLLKIANEV